MRLIPLDHVTYVLNSSRCNSYTIYGDPVLVSHTGRISFKWIYLDDFIRNQHCLCERLRSSCYSLGWRSHHIHTCIGVKTTSCINFVFAENQTRHNSVQSPANTNVIFIPALLSSSSCPTE